MCCGLFYTLTCCDPRTVKGHYIYYIINYRFMLRCGPQTSDPGLEGATHTVLKNDYEIVSKIITYTRHPEERLRDRGNTVIHQLKVCTTHHSQGSKIFFVKFVCYNFCIICRPMYSFSREKMTEKNLHENTDQNDEEESPC